MNRYEQQFYEDIKTIKYEISKIAKALEKLANDRETDRKNK